VAAAYEIRSLAQGSRADHDPDKPRRRPGAAEGRSRPNSAAGPQGRPSLKRLTWRDS